MKSIWILTNLKITPNYSEKEEYASIIKMISKIIKF